MGVSDCEAERGIFLRSTAELGSGSGFEKETSAAEIIYRAVTKLESWWLPSFFISGITEIRKRSHRECAV